MKFQYQSLPSGHHICVLILEPDEGDEVLQGHVETVDLMQTPEPLFEAISYVWGSNIKSHTIQIARSTFFITASLDVALRQTRLRNKQRALWVDALCINQGDNVEKGHR